MKIGAVVLIVGILCGCTSSLAQTAEQKMVLEQIAVLVAADKWCSSDYIVQMDLLDRIVKVAKINIAQSPAKNFLLSKVDEIETAMGGSGATVMCRLAYDLYGPSGKVAKGLMMKR